MKIKTINIYIAVLAIVVITFFIFNKGPEAQTMTGNVASENLDEIIAEVNGMPVIKKEVLKAQEYAKAASGRVIEDSAALEKIISDKLILEDAEKEGFSLTIEETEQKISEILSTQDMSLEDFKARVEAREDNYEEEIENYRQQFIIESFIKQKAEEIEITDEQTLAYYNENKDQMFTGEVALSFEEVSMQLREAMSKELSQETLASYIWKLRENANVIYF